jgi:hypothetical protein
MASPKSFTPYQSHYLPHFNYKVPLHSLKINISSLPHFFH